MAADSEPTHETQATDVIARGMVERLQGFRNRDALTDFKITCGSRSWNVHRLVLAMHSRVLFRVCSGGFREAQENQLDLSDHSPADVDKLITFMYTLDYNSDSSRGLRADVRMYAIADKYDIASLMDRALASFRSRVVRWNLAEIQNDTDLVCALICDAYDTASQELCDPLVSAIANAKVLAQDKNVAESILDCAKKFPELGIDLAKKLSNTDPDPPDEKQYGCTTCYSRWTKRMEPDKTYSCPTCRRQRTGAGWDAEVVGR